MVFDGREVVYKTVVTFEMVIEIIKTKGYDPITIQDFLNDEAGKSTLANMLGFAEPVKWEVYAFELDDIIEEENSFDINDLMGIDTPVLNEGCRRISHSGFDNSADSDITGYEERYEKGGDS